MRIGLLPLARATFDVDFAEQNLAAMLAVLDRTEHELFGPRTLLFDGAAAEEALAAMASADLDRLLVLQVTFTDAAVIAGSAVSLGKPLAIWAVPEPRAGGRLRLNSFCGLNLASHALGLSGTPFSWLYADPATISDDRISGFLSGSPVAVAELETHRHEPDEEAEAVVGRISGKRLARIGAHPEGFHTCAYDPGRLKALAGVEIDELELPDLFERAASIDSETAANLRGEISERVDGLSQVDQPQLERSLKLKAGLDHLQKSGGYDAFAIRCWPETFTEYGGAICGPASLMGEARVPCACEADVYGALTQLVLQEASDSAVFLTDLVDMNEADDTGVVWHCGQAPLSMLAAGARAVATIHTNRRMPLLMEFPLRPGRVTMMRISQAQGTTKMVLAGGDVLDRPMAFTGTSGVVRFDRGVGPTLEDLIACGLEHHLALAYGEHRPVLRRVAGAMGLPVLEL